MILIRAVFGAAKRGLIPRSSIVVDFVDQHDGLFDSFDLRHLFSLQKEVQA